MHNTEHPGWREGIQDPNYDPETTPLNKWEIKEVLTAIGMLGRPSQTVRRDMAYAHSRIAQLSDYYASKEGANGSASLCGEWPSCSRPRMRSGMVGGYGTYPAPHLEPSTSGIRMLLGRNRARG